MIIDDLPDAPDPAIDPPKLFSSKAAAMVLALKKMVTQFRAAIASVNSWLAGGAYAIPYTWGSYSAVWGVAGGLIAINQAANSQNTTPWLYIDIKSAIGNTVAAELGEFDDGTSLVRGKLRIVKVGDASKYLLYDVVGDNASDTYGRAIRVSCTAASSANPFTPGDMVNVFFQRTGDKGDTGSVASFPNLYVRHEVATGVQPDTVSQGTWSNTRALNTVKTNNIPGASLSSNQVTLPAGTYEYVITVPSFNCGAMRARLRNVTDATVVDYGTPEYSNVTYPCSARSILRGQFTIAAAKAFDVQQYQGSTGSAGVPQGVSGVNEIYTEAQFRKIA
jgi:hypothetical protein